MIKAPFLFLLLTVFSLTSCVTKKKYDDLARSKDRLDRDYRELLKVRDEKRQLEVDLQAANDSIRVMAATIREQQTHHQSLEAGRRELNQRIDQLLAQNQALLSASADEKQSLVEEILAKEAELARRTARQDSLAQELHAREQRFQRLEADLAKKEERINELNTILKEREQALTRLREGVMNALKGYSAADLSIREENGRVYVSLSQNLLFATGSDRLDPKGVKALQQLAGVLKGQQDIQILVEGHTDTDGSAEINWDLSVSRATSVVKLLTREGVEPAIITAAGRGFYLPVAPNDTAENKARNRRVEIILAPQLEKILEIIGKS